MNGQVLVQLLWALKGTAGPEQESLAVGDSSQHRQGAPSDLRLEGGASQTTGEPGQEGVA